MCIACDNQSALDYAFISNRLVGANTPDYDIIQATRHLTEDCGFQLRWKHVKGHQMGQDLDIWARLNNRVDALAGEARLDSLLPVPPNNVK